VLPRVAARQCLQLAEQLGVRCARELVARGLDVVDQEPGDDRIGLELPRAVRCSGGPEDLQPRPVTHGQLDEVIGVLAVNTHAEDLDREGPQLRHPLSPDAEPMDALDLHASKILHAERPLP
jgi:hypothetical protein